MLKSLKFAMVALATTTAGVAYADFSMVGRDATPAEVEAWDQDVRPDGLGLPEGSGSVEFGEGVYEERCASCHGDFAEGAGRWPVLAGGQGTLTSDDPNKTIGSYWPYLSTVYDYIHEAMPFGDARSLTEDEIYGITAFLLHMNDLVDYDFVLSKENFGEIRLPNEGGFYMDDRDETEVPLFSAEACMSDCRDPNFEIVARAAEIGVTPETSADATAEEAPAAEEMAATEGDAAAAVDPELAATGEKIFRQCKACHQVGDTAKNATGPLLNGVVGAPVGHIEDFRYSKGFDALKAEGAVWDEANLRAFLANPRAFVKGTKMAFAGLKSDEDIDAVIAYLSQF